MSGGGIAPRQANPNAARARRSHALQEYWCSDKNKEAIVAHVQAYVPRYRERERERLILTTTNKPQATSPPPPAIY
jgi:hypothetical protein